MPRASRVGHTLVFEATGVALDPPKALEAYRMLASVLARSMAGDGVAAVKLAETAGSSRSPASLRPSSLGTATHWGT